MLSNEEQEKKLKGLLKTLDNIKNERNDLRKQVAKLKKELGLLETEGYVEIPSLPLLIYDYVNPPRCEIHGATLAYEYGIYRCEACKTAIQLKPRHGK